MKILNLGSLNIDHVYQMDHFVQPGETEKSLGFQVFPGGKGLNQSVALARAGADVYHAGKIGADGRWLVDLMCRSGVKAEASGDAAISPEKTADGAAVLVRETDCGTGKAIIQVNSEGQNAIILYEGANKTIDRAFIDEVLGYFEAGDILVLQNEINMVPEMIDLAWERGMQIALNPSPANEVIHQCDLRKVRWLLLNEIEGEWLTGKKKPEEMAESLVETYPNMEVVLTLGSQGVLYRSENRKCYQAAFEVNTVDTTGAGDTFTGYFLKCAAAGESPETALRLASKAAAIAVSRPGAAVSIPYWDEVIE